MTQSGRCADRVFTPEPHNYVGSSLADQTSILAFIEDNWLAGERTGPSSFDNIAGSLNDLFTFNDPNAAKVLLNPRTGAVIR